MTTKVTRQNPSRSNGRYRRGMRVYRESRLRTVGVRKNKGPDAAETAAPERLFLGLPRADCADCTLERGKKGEERNEEMGWPLGVEGGELSSEMVDDAPPFGATRSVLCAGSKGYAGLLSNEPATESRSGEAPKARLLRALWCSETTRARSASEPKGGVRIPAELVGEKPSESSSLLCSRAGSVSGDAGAESARSGVETPGYVCRCEAVWPCSASMDDVLLIDTKRPLVKLGGVAGGESGSSIVG